MSIFSVALLASLDAVSVPTPWAEDFETGSAVHLTSGDTGSFSVVGSPVQAGSYALTRTSATGSYVALYDNVTAVSPSASMILSGWVRLTADGAVTAFGGLYLSSAGSISAGYQVVLDRRDSASFPSTNGFQLRKDNSTTVLASSGVISLAVDTWYKITLEWRTGGTRLTAKLYASDGTTLMSTLTSTDAAYTGPLKVGVYAYNIALFDGLYLTP